MRPAPEIGVIVLCGSDANPALRSREALPAAGHRAGTVWAVTAEDAPGKEEIQSAFGSNRLLASDPSEGAAERWNRGARAALAAGADYLLLLEAGCVLHPGALSTLLIALEAQPKAGAACPALVGEDGLLMTCGGRFDALTGRTGPRHRGSDPRAFRERSWERADFAPAACVLIKRELLEDVGLFHGAYGSWGFDAEFGLRARSEYWTVLAVPQAKALHPQVGGDGDERLSARARARTPLWLLRAWGAPATALVALPLAALWSWPLAFASFLVRGRFRCAAAVIRGSWEGFIGSGWRDGAHLAVPLQGRRVKLQVPSSVREMARYF